jgi:CheY-like chemotaxis protein
MKKVLVVDDNLLNMELTIQVLEDDYEVLSAENGEEALRQVEMHEPDLVLMDLSMPVLDGWEAIRRLRAQPKTASLPIIALSAHAIQAEIDRAMEAGASDFVTKPIDEDQLLEKLATLFEAAS